MSILSWFFSVLLYMAALGSVLPSADHSASPIAAGMLAIAATVLLPPFGRYYAQKNGKPLTRGAKAGMLILAFIVAGAVSNKKTMQSSTVVADGSPARAPASIAPSLPQDEVTLARTVMEMNDQYSGAPNEFKKSALRHDRADKIRAALNGRRSFAGWVGSISDMETNSDGNGIIGIEIQGSNVKLGTWNNALSDLSSRSLIPHGSALYKKLENLSKGQLVRVSGTFLPGDKDFIEEQSVTEEGSMSDPEFTVRFSDITPVTQ